MLPIFYSNNFKTDAKKKKKKKKKKKDIFVVKIRAELQRFKVDPVPIHFCNFSRVGFPTKMALETVKGGLYGEKESKHYDMSRTNWC